VEEGLKPFGAIEQALEKIAPAGSEAFHYTFDRVSPLIQSQGLNAGSYATTTSELSPLQAHIDLVDRI